MILRQDRRHQRRRHHLPVAYAFGTRPVTVVLIRDRSTVGYDLALVTTDTAASTAQIIERYVSRWSIEVAIEGAWHVFCTGQVRN